MRMHWMSVKSTTIDAAGLPHDVEVWAFYEYQVTDHLASWIRGPVPIYGERRLFRL